MFAKHEFLFIRQSEIIVDSQPTGTVTAPGLSVIMDVKLKVKIITALKLFKNA